MGTVVRLLLAYVAPIGSTVTTPCIGDVMLSCPYIPRCRQRFRWLAVITLSSLSGTTPTWADQVWVVTDASHPVTTVPAGSRLIDLAAPTRLMAALNHDLPPDALQANIIAHQRLSAAGADFQRQLAMAFQGVVDGWNLGITMMPAVVVDRHYVVYGDPDVAHAVGRIENYRRQHP